MKLTLITSLIQTHKITIKIPKIINIQIVIELKQAIVIINLFQKKSKNNLNTQSRSNGTYGYKKLKPKKIVMSVFFGATIGLAVGGALVMSCGALAVVLGNMALYSGVTTIFGVSTLAVIQGGQYVQQYVISI